MGTLNGFPRQDRLWTLIAGDKIPAIISVRTRKWSCISPAMVPGCIPQNPSIIWRQVRSFSTFGKNDSPSQAKGRTYTFTLLMLSSNSLGIARIASVLASSFPPSHTNNFGGKTMTGFLSSSKRTATASNTGHVV